MKRTQGSLLLLLSFLLLTVVQGSVFPWNEETEAAIDVPLNNVLPKSIDDFAVAGCILNATYPNFLPWTVLPRHYQLNISAPNPNTGAMTYNGTITINVDIIQPTTCVVLHASSMTFSSVNLNIGTNNLTPSSITFNNTYQFAILQFSLVLPLRSATRSISFAGQFNTVGAGFFISDNTYSPSSPEYPQTDEDRAAYARGYPSHHAEIKPPTPTQATRKMYATQMEPTSARRAFPCFDEPDLKATWQAKISVPANQGLTALFNTRESSIYTTIVNGVAVTHFEFQRTLQVQSSYLVAMAVGEFDYVEANDGGIRFRVYTPPGASQYGSFALNLTVGIVKHFGEIWDLPFSQMNTKMDQISVPNIIENAMENWGLLTYWPPFLLVDAKNSSRVAKELVSIVVVHEISHQWFGDTITCPSFQSEFLQEGFARLFQYTGTQYLFPEWEVFSKPAPGTAFGDISFYGWPYDLGMGGDYKGVSPPIIVPLNETALSTMFYEKGACINRMVYLNLGRDKWNQVLKYHLHTHKWTNPNVYDLAKSFDTIAPELNYKQNILPWLLQPNFPAVTLTVNANNTVTLTQQQLSKYAGQNLFWPWIPLRLRGEAGTRSFESEVILTRKSQNFNLPPKPAGASRWYVQGNYNYTSFVVVNYAQKEDWNLFLQRSALPSFFSVDRREQLQAVFMLATLNHVPISLALELTAHYLPELLRNWVSKGDFASASDLMQTITTQWQPIFSPLLPQPHTRGIERELASGLFKPLLAQIGWSGNGTASADTLRSLVTFWAVYLADSAAITQATRIFDQQGLKVPADSRKAVLLAAALSNDKNRYAKLQAAFLNNSTSAADAALVLFALAAGPTDQPLCVQSLKLFTQRYSDFAERLSAAKQMLTNNRNENCRKEAWNYYQSNALQYWRTSGASASSAILSGIDQGFSTQQGKSDVQSFLNTNKQLGSLTAAQISKVLTLIQINIDLAVNS